MSLGGARRTVMVTGAAGFLGSHLVDRLLAESFEVIGLDNLMTGALSNLEHAGRDRHFHLEIGDVREPIKAYAEIVFNFACPASPKHYQSDPRATFSTSVLGALRIADHAIARRCRIVHASTSEVYGDPLEHPQREDYWGHVNPIGERACYDEGKRAAETVFADLARATGADARVLRIFNTYGPRMAFDDGRVVSNFVVQALRGEALTIYGSGQQSRSFCYVDDLVDGIFRAAMAERFASPTNLGNPEEFTMLALAETVSAVLGLPLKLDRRPLPNDDPRRRRPDVGRANTLGWRPRVPLEEGIRRTCEDFRARIAQGVGA